MGTAAYYPSMHNCTCNRIQTFEEYERADYNKVVKELRLENKELIKENAHLYRIIRNLTGRKIT